MQSEELIRSIIKRIAIGPDRGKDIDQNEAKQAMISVLNDELNPVHAALFLIGLRMKSETIEEYIGIFQGIHSFVDVQESKLERLLYLADPYDGYLRNIPTSPFIPAIMAACGTPCIMQGIHSVGPKFGVTSHQVYQELGINPLNTTKENITRLENPDIAWSYLDQTISHPKLAALSSFRDLIVKRSAITTVERLLLPIKAKHNMLALGFVHKAYPEIYGALAQNAGFDFTVLIKGLEGGVTPALNKPIRSFYVDRTTIHDKKVGELDNYLLEKMALNTSFEGTSKELLDRTIDTASTSLKTRQGTFFEALKLHATYLLWKFNHDSSDKKFKEALDTVSDALETDSVLKRLNFK